MRALAQRSGRRDAPGPGGRRLGGAHHGIAGVERHRRPRFGGAGHHGAVDARDAVAQRAAVRSRRQPGDDRCRGAGVERDIGRLARAGVAGRVGRLHRDGVASFGEACGRVGPGAGRRIGDDPCRFDAVDRQRDGGSGFRHALQHRGDVGDAVAQHAGIARRGQQCRAQRRGRGVDGEAVARRGRAHVAGRVAGRDIGVVHPVRQRGAGEGPLPQAVRLGRAHGDPVDEDGDGRPCFRDAGQAGLVDPGDGVALHAGIRTRREAGQHGRVDRRVDGDRRGARRADVAGGIGRTHADPVPAVGQRVGGVAPRAVLIRGDARDRGTVDEDGDGRARLGRAGEGGGVAGGDAVARDAGVVRRGEDRPGHVGRGHVERQRERLGDQFPPGRGDAGRDGIGAGRERGRRRERPVAERIGPGGAEQNLAEIERDDAIRIGGADQRRPRDPRHAVARNAAVRARRQTRHAGPYPICHNDFPLRRGRKAARAPRKNITGPFTIDKWGMVEVSGSSGDCLLSGLGW